MIVKLDNVAAGVNADAMPEELQDGQWSSALNIVFRGGFAERAPSMGALFAAPSVTPYFITPFRSATALMWVHVGTQKAFVDDGTTRTEIGRVAAYTGTSSDRWTGGAFNGVLVLNNGVDAPQYWTGNTAARFVDLPNWTAGAKCRALRPFRNFLVAMGLTLAGTLYPFRVRWSAIADPGTYPPSWDITDATREAGEIDVAGAAGPIVDALPLGDQLMIYTTGSTHVMRWVGGRYVMSVTPVAGGVGMLARNCGALTPLGHVVMTTGDIVLQGDGPPRSIATGRVRRTIFEQLDNASAERACFVCANPSFSEAWICYPTAGSGVANRAAIWNWVDDTWSFRELSAATSGATGQTPTPVGQAWSARSDTWEDASDAWGATMAGPNDQHLVIAHAMPAISLVGNGTQDIGATKTSTLERVGLHLGDPLTVKTLRSVWLRIDAPAGTVINVQVGASMTADVAPTWKDEKPFIVGTSKKIDAFATGRFLALRISSPAQSQWRMRGIALDADPSGAW